MCKDITPIMENQMENHMENEMETALGVCRLVIVLGLDWSYIGVMEKGMQSPI